MPASHQASFGTPRRDSLPRQTRGQSLTSQAEQFNQRNIAEFRANHGRVGGNFAGAPLLLLHTVGARSGLLADLARPVLGARGQRGRQPAAVRGYTSARNGPEDRTGRQVAVTARRLPVSGRAFHGCSPDRSDAGPAGRAAPRSFTTCCGAWPRTVPGPAQRPGRHAGNRRGSQPRSAGLRGISACARIFAVPEQEVPAAFAASVMRTPTQPGSASPDTRESHSRRERRAAARRGGAAGRRGSGLAESRSDRAEPQHRHHHCPGRPGRIRGSSGHPPAAGPAARS
jgi:hypothetical protein